MTVEFPDEQTRTEVATPLRRPWPGLAWAVPTGLAVVALFLPVTTSVYAATPGGDGGFSGSFRIDTYPFGRVHVPQLGIDTSSGAPYGWLWLAVAVGFALAGGLAILRPGTARPWPAVVGLVAAAAGIGGVVTLQLETLSAQSQRATSLGLAAGSWVLVAAGVVGLALGVLTSGRAPERVQSSPASANAEG